MHEAHITLSDEHHDLAMSVIEAGEFSSLSEVVGDALREWKQRRKARADGLATVLREREAVTAAE